ncbi:MAG TPA: YbhB/YbcL family Raf kinase inhibitor-like protein [Gammaproteobacteria bacterium]
MNAFADIQPSGVPDMKLSSPAFKHLSHSQSPQAKYTPADGDEDSSIPVQYTCKGADTSPELRIDGIPANTKSLALIMDDPDAPVGTFVHWLIWNIPPDTKTLDKGQRPPGIQGLTDFGKRGYGGPCPPSGIHRYYFKLYALDTTLDIPNHSNKSDLVHAMQDHIIGKAELIGLFKR